MGPRRKCTFNSELKKEFPFIQQNNSESSVYCTTCKSSFSVASMGRTAITTHLKTDKHKDAKKTIDTNKKMSDIFKRKLVGKSEQVLVAQEGLMAYHSARHYHSFNSVSCTSKIIKNLYEPKFTCGKTKCASIIVSVFAPFSIKNIVSDLEKSNFVSIYFDSSNHKNIKMVPLLVRYFVPLQGAKVKLLEFESKEGETSDIISNYAESTMSKYDLQKKIHGICADNTNTNYGGSERRGENNVYFKMKKKLNRDLVGVGCAAHIIHNSIKNASDILPIDMEVVVVKIYSHFYIYTVRSELLKEFCETADTEYTNLLGYCKTRFLELFHSLERIIKLYEPLKNYFLSLKKCPAVLKAFFENSTSYIWLIFMHHQAGIFNTAVLQVEGQKTTIFKVAEVIKKLRNQLQCRKKDKFLPATVKTEMNKLVSTKSINKKEFLSTVCQFYQNCFDYLEEWAYPFAEFENYTWMELTSPLSTWDKLEPSVLSLVEKVKAYEIELDDTKLYDEFILVREFTDEEKVSEWKSKNLDSDERWVEIFSYFYNKQEPLNSLEILVEFIISLPGTNAPTERVFSKANKIWTKEKGMLDIETLKALLIINSNFDMDCMEFYKFLLSEPTLLTKIHSSAKYD